MHPTTIYKLPPTIFRSQCGALKGQWLTVVVQLQAQTKEVPSAPPRGLAYQAVPQDAWITYL